MVAKGISNPATTRRVIELLGGLDWTEARVADVGAGRGHFSYVLGEELREERGLDVERHIFPCDLIPESFEYERLTCLPLRADGSLPWDDDSFDAVVSIEVVEHVEDQFGFVRELARIARPGGLVIVTTPNVLNLNSRLRTLCWGFPTLFDPLPLEKQDVRFMGGHIHPIGPYYLAYDALRAGLSDPELHSDRTKRSAAALSIALAPLLLAGRSANLRRLKRKHPDVLEQNRDILGNIHSWKLLTARTAILVARKPLESPAPVGG